MRLWVTGASGFVARHAIPLLHSEGHEILGFGLHAEAPAWLPAGRYRMLDVSVTADVERAVREWAPEGVLHLAGQSSAGLSFQQPEETFRQNLGSALGLLEGLRRAGIRPRVLMVSSSEVYGPQESATPVAEDSPIHVVSPYGASKLAAETVGQTYATCFDFPVVRVRPFSHTGAGQDPRFALSSFAQQVARAERGRQPGRLRVGNLEVVRDYMDVADVARAYSVLLARAVPGEVYNIASGRGYRMGDLLQRLVARSRVPLTVETDAARLRAQDFNFMVGDASRLRSLGWTPQSSVDRALDQLLESWRSAPGESSGS